MGCFLGCFGASKDDKKRHKNTHNLNHSYHHTPTVVNQYNGIQQNVAASAKQDYVEKPINVPVPEPRVEPEEDQLNLNLTDQGKQEEQVSLGTRRRVTFNSDVKEYEHVSVSEVPEITLGNEKGPEQGVAAGSEEPSVSESGSSLSSSASFPPNHRYRNCRDSDEEDEDLDCEVSDLDEDEDEDEFGQDGDEAYDAEYSDDEYYARQVPAFSNMSSSPVESGTKSVLTPGVIEKHSDEIKDQGSLAKEEKTPPGFYRGARDRAGYVHSVLNPIENTAQWKNVKSKPIPSSKQPKENSQTDLGSKRSSVEVKAVVDEPESNHEIAVDASLSTWLISSQKTPRSKASTTGLEPIYSGASVSSHGSNSVRSHEERPILGALTTEELKQFSASSLRNSPSRSPEEKPLVGTVGIHWNSRYERTPVDNSGSASSFKGIPNTTSKYREDKSVKWHSTPFETRLERALNRSAADSRT